MIFQTIGLLILASFYGCYFVKMFSQKRRGIKTDQMGKGTEGRARFIELVLKAVTVIVPVLEAVCIILNVSALPDRARIAGACIAAAGTAVFVTSVITMKDSWRAGIPAKDRTELVTSGIYQISRNPAFLGFDMVYAGILLMFFNWVLFALSVFAAVMFHLQIVLVEEKYLESTFGRDYLEYRDKVSRYLGRKFKHSKAFP